MPSQSLEIRLKNNSTINAGGCWVWKLSKDRDGYGQIKLPGRITRRAHRVSYAVFNGAFDESLQLDHLCRVRSCINPDHLEPVTCAENLHRGVDVAWMVNAAKTHCPQGHEYTHENTTIERGGRSRRCKQCALARNRLRKRLATALNPKKHYSQVLKERTHCKYGHEFTVENTWVEKTGTRHCRTCHRERARKSSLKGVLHAV